LQIARLIQSSTRKRFSGAWSARALTSPPRCRRTSHSAVPAACGRRP